MAGPSRCRVRKRKTGFVALFRTTPANTVCPNFFVLAHANGCAFSPQCSYCYLKSSFWYLGQQEAFGNIEDMLAEVRQWIAKDKLETYVLNAGNLSDSLSFEPVRPLVARLVETFREHAAGRPHTLLLVTKGGQKDCRPLLSVAPCANVVVSFSVNNPAAAEKFESGAASVQDRLKAAERLKKKGWRVRMRIDPMMAGYDYSRVAKSVHNIRPERVTLGSLRAEPGLLKKVKNGMFKQLLPPAHPKGLARYPLEQRLCLYNQAVEQLRGICDLALCEEEPHVWDALELDKTAMPCNCGG